MNSIRTTLFGFAASAALAGLTHALPSSVSFQEAAPSADTQGCQCTCADCMAKHGAKAADAPAPAVLPELPTDIEAEVAKALAAELSSVEEILGVAVLTDVTNEVEAPEARRGYMGISLDMSSEEVGAVVSTVAPNGPAARAGLLPGDTIVVAEEMPVESPEDLIAALIELQVGDTATIEVERGGTELEMSMELVAQEDLDPSVEESTGTFTLNLIEEFRGEPVEIEVDLEDDFEIVLPEETPRLTGLGYLGEDEETVTTEVIEEVRGEGRKQRGARRKAKRRSADPLPEGYIEIETRRERRPASADSALAERVEQLEAEVAELQRIVDQLRAELDRRNPR
ncbi:putative periplasmic serine endoprotease DegP-like precursor [Planctomycetes bacterium Poly30]|uniref:Putative periplasmic serine endoprotease DegP-like n=1 Tax=Saltatorellus ferox TaxID=2528018 RepID=A0A518EXX8_9BACT|nr:putative periplasmic serine endoprotease DegP-like precursor [Planctomycetes bacterium Poly30]